MRFYIFLIQKQFQGASTSFPALYCNIKQNKLKNHGKEPHNFQTVQCCERKFEEIETDFQNQIRQLNEDFGVVEDFTKFVVVNNRHDIERKFRDNGKNHNSVIGTINTCVDSMDFIVGGGLHNEIGKP